MRKKRIQDVNRDNFDNVENESVERPDDARRLEERLQQLRPTLNMEFRDPLYIDSTVIPKGWEYCWIRASLLGKQDEDNMVAQQKEGWTPVPQERHPDMVFSSYLGRSEHTKSFIYYGGLILCERPKEYGNEKRRILSEENKKLVESMPGTENFMGESAIPAKFIQDQKITRSFDV
jgi:hypothetical protein